MRGAMLLASVPFVLCLGFGCALGESNRTTTVPATTPRVSALKLNVTKTSAAPAPSPSPASTTKAGSSKPDTTRTASSLPTIRVKLVNQSELRTNAYLAAAATRAELANSNKTLAKNYLDARLEPLGLNVTRSTAVSAATTSAAPTTSVVTRRTAAPAVPIDTKVDSSNVTQLTPHLADRVEQTAVNVTQTTSETATTNSADAVNPDWTQATDYDGARADPGDLNIPYSAGFHLDALVAPVDQNGTQTTLEPSDDTSPEEPVDTSPEEPVDTSPEEPVDTSPEEPVETSPEEPVETSPEEPVDTSPEEPVETSPEEPVDTSPEDPVDPDDTRMEAEPAAEVDDEPVDENETWQTNKPASSARGEAFDMNVTGTTPEPAAAIPGEAVSLNVTSNKAEPVASFHAELVDLNVIRNTTEPAAATARGEPIDVNVTRTNSKPVVTDPKEPVSPDVTPAEADPIANIHAEPVDVNVTRQTLESTTAARGERVDPHVKQAPSEPAPTTHVESVDLNVTRKMDKPPAAVENVDPSLTRGVAEAAITIPPTPSAPKVMRTTTGPPATTHAEPIRPRIPQTTAAPAGKSLPELVSQSLFWTKIEHAATLRVEPSSPSTRRAPTRHRSAGHRWGLFNMGVTPRQVERPPIPASSVPHHRPGGTVAYTAGRLVTEEGSATMHETEAEADSDAINNQLDSGHYLQPSVSPYAYWVSDQFINFINNNQSNWTAGRNFRGDLQKQDLKRLVGRRVGRSVPITRRLSSLIPSFLTTVIGGLQAMLRNSETHFDLRAVSRCVTRPMDTGFTATSWAVSTVQAVEDRWCHAKNDYKVTRTFSTEYLNNCCDLCLGTGEAAGSPMTAYNFMMSNGLPGKDCKSYSIPALMRALGPAASGRALPPPPHKKVCLNECDERDLPLFYVDLCKISSAHYLFPGWASSIMHEIKNRGSVTAEVTIYSDFLNYKGGVYSPVEGAEPFGDLTLRLIGWSTSGPKPYWLAIGVWGRTWGDHGLVKLRAFDPKLNIESRVSVARVDESSCQGPQEPGPIGNVIQ